MDEEKKIEKLVEKKVEQKLEERLKKENVETVSENRGWRESAKRKIKKVRGDEPEDMSRRKFLKGLGAAGIGAAAITSPVAGSLRVSPDGITEDGEEVYVPRSGNVSVTGNLGMDGNEINGISVATGESGLIDFTGSNLYFKIENEESNFVFDNHEGENIVTIENQGSTKVSQRLEVDGELRIPVYETEDDLPEDAEKGSIAYVEETEEIYSAG